MCVCVFSSHSFGTSTDVPAGVTQEEGNTGFSIHLLSAVLALIFLARRIQPFLSLVDREVESAMSARRGEGLSGGCKAGLTLKEEDSFLLPPRPWPWCGGGVGSARCSLGTHPPCESSTCQRFKRRHVRRFGACAEADDTVVESWCVLIAPGV